MLLGLNAVSSVARLSAEMAPDFAWAFTAKACADNFHHLVDVYRALTHHARTHDVALNALRTRYGRRS